MTEPSERVRAERTESKGEKGHRCDLEDDVSALRHVSATASSYYAVRARSSRKIRQAIMIGMQQPAISRRTERIILLVSISITSKKKVHVVVTMKLAIAPLVVGSAAAFSMNMKAGKDQSELCDVRSDM